MDNILLTQVQKVSQVKVGALLDLLEHLDPEEKLAEQDLKVGDATVFTLIYTVTVEKSLIFFSPCCWQQVTEVCRETADCQASLEKRVNMDSLELDFQAQLVLKVHFRISKMFLLLEGAPQTAFSAYRLIVHNAVDIHEQGRTEMFHPCF